MSPFLFIMTLAVGVQDTESPGKQQGIGCTVGKEQGRIRTCVSLTHDPDTNWMLPLSQDKMTEVKRHTLILKHSRAGQRDRCGQV
jgi:hypothetical protein